MNKPVPHTAPPWNQRADETDTAYHRFSIYLELGPDRSLVKVRQKLGKTTSYTRQLATWSSKYDWVERAGDYDRHLQAKVLEGKKEVIDSAKGRIYQQVHTALDELFAIIEGPDFQLTEGGVSLIAQKLKAIELTLRLAGITPPQEPTDEAPVTINNFIQNVYKKLETINDEEKPE